MPERTSLADFNTLGSTYAGVTQLETQGTLKQGAQILPSSKCVGFWKLNETSGTSAADSSMWVRGRFNGALSFDGVDDYVQVADSASLDITGDLTVEAWVYFNTVDQTDKRIVSKWGDTTGEQSYEIRTNNGNQFTFLVGTGAGQTSIVATTAFQAGKWYHVAGTHNPTTDLIRLFVNGTEAATAVSHTVNVPATTTNLRIGDIGDGSGTNKIAAIITEVRISNSIRYTADFTPSTTQFTSDANTAMLLHFDEGTGTSAADSSSNANTGTFNGANVGTINGTPSFTLTGIRARANTMDFDATNDMVEVTDNATLTLGAEHTIQMWIDFDTAAGIKRIIAKEHETPSLQGYTVYSGDTSANLINWRKDSTTLTSVSSVAMNTWTHIMLVQDTAGMKMYINGTLDASNATTGAPTDITENLFIGRKTIAASEFMDGQIQNVIILNKAITPFDPEYDGPIAKPLDRGVTASTVGYWKLQETSGTSHTDSSTNALTGTSSGTPGLNKVGILDKAVDFDGTDDYINVPDNNVLDITGDLTLEAWIQPDVTTTGYICSKWTPGSQESYILYLFSGKPTMTIDIAGVDTTLGLDLVLTVGKWYHIAGVFNAATDEMKMYVNGVLMKTSTGIAGTITATTAPFRIGTEGNGGNLFNGRISHVRVSNAALTPNQFLMERSSIATTDWMDHTSAKTSHTLSWSEDITATGVDVEAQLRTSDIQPVDSNTMAYWSFEDSLADASMNKVPLTLFGEAFFTTGKSGRGVAFDGINGYLETPNAAQGLDNIFAGGGTIEMWIYPRSDGETDSGLIIGKYRATGLGWSLRTKGETAGNMLLEFIHVFSTTSGEWETPVSIPINTWSHISLTYNNSSTTNVPTIKLNGTTLTLTTITTPAGTASSDAGNKLTIGGNGDGAATFDGIIDEVRISNVIRTTFLNNLSDFYARRTAPAGTAETTASHRYSMAKMHMITNDT